MPLTTYRRESAGREREMAPLGGRIVVSLRGQPNERGALPGTCGYGPEGAAEAGGEAEAAAVEGAAGEVPADGAGGRDGSGGGHETPASPTTSANVARSTNHRPSTITAWPWRPATAERGRPSSSTEYQISARSADRKRTSSSKVVICEGGPGARRRARSNTVARPCPASTLGRLPSGPVSPTRSTARRMASRAAPVDRACGLAAEPLAQRAAYLGGIVEIDRIGVDPQLGEVVAQQLVARAHDRLGRRRELVGRDRPVGHHIGERCGGTRLVVDRALVPQHDAGGGVEPEPVVQAHELVRQAGGVSQDGRAGDRSGPALRTRTRHHDPARPVLDLVGFRVTEG